MKRIVELFLEAKGKDMSEGVTQEMVDFFEMRTNAHIDRNKKFVKIACEQYPEHAERMTEEVNKHDDSKWEEPEYTPYLHITWMYKLKDEGKEYKVPDDIDIQEATFHHVKNNHHHPEMYDDNVTKESINPHNRDEPADPVDGTKMPDHAIICMVCDWCSMSDEKGGNTKDWADMNVNVRWMFTDEQKDLIYEAIDKIWSAYESQK